MSSPAAGETSSALCAMSGASASSAAPVSSSACNAVKPLSSIESSRTPRKRAVSSCASSRNALRSTGLSVGAFCSDGIPERNGTTLAATGTTFSMGRSAGAAVSAVADAMGAPLSAGAVSAGGGAGGEASLSSDASRRAMNPIGRSRRPRCKRLIRSRSRQTPNPRYPRKPRSRSNTGSPDNSIGSRSLPSSTGQETTTPLQVSRVATARAI